MVVGFTYRGHQIFLLVYCGDVRPVRLLADDLFADVVLHRGTRPPQRNGITTYRNAIGVLLANTLGFSLALLCADKGYKHDQLQIEDPRSKTRGKFHVPLPLLTEGVLILEFGTHCDLME
jgi:hypothetical protein